MTQFLSLQVILLLLLVCLDESGAFFNVYSVQLSHTTKLRSITSRHSFPSFGIGTSGSTRSKFHTETCMQTLDIKLPQSVAEMMRSAGSAVAEGLKAGCQLMSVEVPLPITGGTELDDWPGGIGQKYRTLRPMAIEMMRNLNVSQTELEQQDFIGLPNDAVGIWRCKEFVLVCFATPEVLSDLEGLKETKPLILLNHQFFLNEFSKERSKKFIASSTIVYLLQSLNVKGPGLLPIKGVLSRIFPSPFLLGRRLDGGGVAVLGSFEGKPPRTVIDGIFSKDSEERDKGLSLWDRLKRIQQDASQI